MTKHLVPFCCLAALLVLGLANTKEDSSQVGLTPQCCSMLPTMQRMLWRKGAVQPGAQLQVLCCRHMIHCKQMSP